MSIDFGPPVGPPRLGFPFSPVPNWAIDYCLKHMGKNELKLLLYLVRTRHRKTGLCMRQRKTICDRTGIPIRQISAASERLVVMNIIKKGRKGNTTWYRLNTNPPPALVQKSLGSSPEKRVV